jgi:hypothetical protein
MMRVPGVSPVHHNMATWMPPSIDSPHVLVREKKMEEGRRLPRSIYRRIASVLDDFGNRHPLLRKRHMSFIVTIIFVVLLVAVILTGYFYYQGDKQSERMESGMDCKFSIIGVKILKLTLSRSQWPWTRAQCSSETIARTLSSSLRH